MKEKRPQKLVKSVGGCDECSGEVSLYEDEPEKVSENLETGKEVYDSNLRMVYSSMVNDIVNNGLMKQCSVLGVPHFSERVYQKYKTVICSTVSSKFQNYQNRAVEAIFKFYGEELDIHPCDNGILDIDVSFDGSWMTRGHKSRIGVAFVVDCNTEIVVDLAVLSTYCHSCTLLARQHTRNSISEEEFRKRREEHKENCWHGKRSCQDFMEQICKASKVEVYSND